MGRGPAAESVRPVAPGVNECCKTAIYLSYYLVPPHVTVHEYMYSKAVLSRTYVITAKETTDALAITVSHRRPTRGHTYLNVCSVLFERLRQGRCY